MKKNNKMIISVLLIFSLIILAILVLMPEKLANILTKDVFVEPTAQNKTTESLAGIVANTSEIVYNGSTPFYVMNGVKATDVDGTDMTDKISATITSGEIRTEKTIKYSVYDCEGVLHKLERKLQLIDYEGPSITVPESIKLKKDELDEILALLIESNQITAENGYGISTVEQVVYQVIPLEEEGYYRIIFSTYNEFMDAATAEMVAYVEDDEREEELI
ncbi:MAG: hypothetical protein E7269_07325 [Lachnospiraceae bacterium]|nr:hypothetical protein [Lachnospiraceae bacterium]